MSENIVRKERLTVKEVATELGVQYITALGYIHDKKIKGVKIGGQWKVAREEVDRFLDEGNHPDSQTDNDDFEEDFKL